MMGFEGGHFGPRLQRPGDLYSEGAVVQAGPEREAELGIEKRRDDSA